MANMAAVTRDIRFAIRMMTRSPGFTSIAIVVLALGIGATTAIYSIASVALIRPLPFPGADRIVRLWDVQPQIDRTPASFPEFTDWKNQSEAFETMASLYRVDGNLTSSGEPARIRMGRVSGDLFSVLRVQPLIGRNFVPEEDLPGAQRVAILGHQLWTERFAGDKSIIGKTLELNQNTYSIIGVMPAEMGYLSEVEVWVPAAYLDETRSNRGLHFLTVLGRLRPGMRLDQAQANMNTVVAALQKQYSTDHNIMLVSLRDMLYGNTRPALLLFLGAVAFVLLIAWANVANLQLARGAARQREIAIRVALGAGQTRLIRQLLTESVVLSLLGGGLGIMFAVALKPLLVANSPRNVGYIKAASLDTGVLLFTLAVSVVTGIVFGLVPALHASRPDLNQSLKEGGRSSDSQSHGFLRSSLVAAEVALSIVLLAGAGLAIKSFSRLMQVNPGFNPRNVLAMDVRLPGKKYGEGKQVAHFFDQLLEQIKAIPGVELAGITNTLPLSGGSTNGDVNIEGRTYGPNDQPISDKYVVSADYFRAMGIRLIEGRFFSDADTSGTKPVAIVNESMAKRIWPGESPIGKRIQFSWLNNDWQEIVGVAGDVKTEALDATTPLETYVTYRQAPFSEVALVVQTSGNPIDFATAVRTQVLSVDSQQPVYNISTMEQMVSRSVSDRRFTLFVLGLFAGLALVLSAAGVYGVISYWVAQQTHEMGIRMALGANRRDVWLMVLGHSGKIGVAGVVIGLAGAFALTRLMASLLFGVSPTDPAVFAAIPIVLIAIVVLASLVPSFRATRLDPIRALRHE